MQLETSTLPLDGCHAARLPTFGDARGGFQKLFHAPAFQAHLPGFLPQEAYVTTSAKGVLRGMHFQLPPHDHAKVVVCLSGAVSDVVLDLRPGPGFGRFALVRLSPEGQNAVLLPKGIAHGFYAHAENSALLYLVETVHAPDHDAGILWSSFGCDWPLEPGGDGPVLSERDTRHPELAAFSAPAAWGVDRA